MFQQLGFFFIDYKKICGRHTYRYVYVWLNRIPIGILVYRLERGMYLLFGNGWKFIRIFLTPLLNLMYAYSNCEIHYQASIGPGLSVLHAAPGVVVSARATIGKNLTLVGGNIIGIREGKDGVLSIGDNCYLGANAVILGPIVLGDDTTIGACALVVSDFQGKGTLVGVPSKPILPTRVS